MRLQTIYTLILFTTFSASLSFAGTNLVFYGQAEHKELDSKKPLRVLSWNIHKLEDINTYQDVFKLSKNSDIMVLQESMMNNVTRDFFGEITIGLETLGAISFNTNSDGGTGVATSSRIQNISATPIRSRETEPILNTPKMILITEYKIKDAKQTLMVANIHGLNFVPNWKFGVQLSQLEVELSKHPGPILLAGDFNTHNPPKTRLLAEMVKRLKLKHIEMPNKKFFRLDLDHIFARGFNVRHASLLHEFTSSDHTPLWAELEFKHTLSLPAAYQ